MIKARVVPKSWLNRYTTWLGYTSSSRSSDYLWREGYKPEVERMSAADDRQTRVWRLQSSPDGVGGHQIDLFIDKETLLEETIKAYGGRSGVMHALADEVASSARTVSRQRREAKKREAHIEELEERLQRYERAAGIR